MQQKLTSFSTLNIYQHWEIQFVLISIRLQFKILLLFYDTK